MAPGGTCENKDSISLFSSHPGSRPRSDLLGQRAPCANHAVLIGSADATDADAGYSALATDAATVADAVARSSASFATDSVRANSGSESDSEQPESEQPDAKHAVSGHAHSELADA